VATKLAYKRALLKLSGEAFAGGRASGIDFGVIERLSDELKSVTATGVQLGFGHRRRQHPARHDRKRAGDGPRLRRLHGDARHRHQCLALQDILEKKGVDTRVMTAIRMESSRSPTFAAAPCGTSTKDAW